MFNLKTEAGHEIEVKLRCEGVESLRRAGIGLELERERHFEDNSLFDTAAGELRARMAVLRVRDAGGEGLLTFKGSARPDAPPSQFKQRVEIETAVGDAAQMVAILEQLGYRKFFRYQKWRTVYRALLPGGGRLSVMRDETPLGDFIELEGEEVAIAAAVRLLGATPADYILDSYLGLQAERCRAAGLPLKDLVFTPSGGPPIGGEQQADVGPDDEH